MTPEEKKQKSIEKRKAYVKEYNKKYKAEHKEENREDHKKYRERHREKLKKDSKEYNLENFNKVKERNKIRYESNKQKYKDRSKKYYDEHKFYTEEKCRELMKNYEYLKDFSKNCPSAYMTCLKNGWEIPLKRIGNLYKRCGYRMYFHSKENPEKLYIYVGLTYNYNKRIYEHLNYDTDNVYRYVKEYNLNYDYSEQYHDYIDAEQASINEKNNIKFYRDNSKYIVMNRKSGGGLGGRTGPYNPKYQ